MSKNAGLSATTQLELKSPSGSSALKGLLSRLMTVLPVLSYTSAEKDADESSVFVSSSGFFLGQIAGSCLIKPLLEIHQRSCTSLLNLFSFAS